MHGKWFHQKHYSRNNVFVATDGATTLQALGQNPKRRGIMISIGPTVSTLPKLCLGMFGQNPGALALGQPCDFIIGSYVCNLFLSYDDWGEVLEQQLWIFSNDTGGVVVTEIIDSTPECECYEG